ncbi:MAG: hypothetical protein FWH27_15615 [Planctomycetaceae bacterium]|nr:hypothetical protein [Planctomycetaceae bacterium]
MDDYKKDFLCDYLEDSMDKQDHLPWEKRDWDLDKLRSYMACCFALPYFVKNDHEVLARMLRCFCDAESGGVQEDLIRACEAFSDDPYHDTVFIGETVKVAAEMLKKSPMWFGTRLFACVVFRSGSKPFFLNAFESLEKQEDQQIIVDFLTYKLECYSPEKQKSQFMSEEQCAELQRKYIDTLNECLQISGLEKGNGDFFWESIQGLQFKPVQGDGN